MGLAALGCAKFQTARECGTFVEAIKTWKNQPAAARSASTASAPLVAPSTSGPAAASVAARESTELAERYDDLATRIDALHLTSPELVPRAGRYQKLAREAAHALRDVADAVQKGQTERARQRRIEFEDIARSEAPLVADINTICH